MRSLIVLVSSLAVVVCSPTLGLLSGHHGSGGLGKGLPGGGGGGCHDGKGGAAVPLGHGGSVPGAGIIGGIVKAGLAGLGGLHGPGGRTDRGHQQKGGVYPVGGGGIFQALGFLAQGLTDIVGNAHSIFDDIIHLRIPGILDDGFNAVISAGRACGGIINALIPGLGSLLGNLVVSIGKIFICFLGSPGLTGSILGDRRPGRDNPRDIPYVCNRDYDRKCGYDYDGSYSNANEVIVYFRVRDARRQALKIINDYTRGKGVDSLSGPQRIICERILIVTDILGRDCNKWNSNDISILSVNIIIVVSVLGDSYKQGLGPKIADEYINFLKKNNKNKRFPDISGSRQDIYDALKGTKECDWNGAFNKNNQDTYDDRSDNSNDRSDNQQNSNDEADRSDGSDTRNDGNSAEEGSNGNDGSDDTAESNRRGSQYQRKAASTKSDKESSDSTNNSQRSGSGSTVTNADGSEVAQDNYQNSADATTNQASDKNSANNEEITSNGPQGSYSKITADKDSAKKLSATQNRSQNSGSDRSVKNADGSTSDESNFAKSAESGSQQASDIANAHGEEVKSTDASGRTYDRKEADSNRALNSSDAKKSNQSSGSEKVTKNADGSEAKTYNYEDSAEAANKQASQKESSHAVEETWTG